MFRYATDFRNGIAEAEFLGTAEDVVGNVEGRGTLGHDASFPFDVSAVRKTFHAGGVD